MEVKSGCLDRLAYFVVVQRNRESVATRMVLAMDPGKELMEGESQVVLGAVRVLELVVVSRPSGVERELATWNVV